MIVGYSKVLLYAGVQKIKQCVSTLLATRVFQTHKKVSFLFFNFDSLLLHASNSPQLKNTFMQIEKDF